MQNLSQELFLSFNWGLSLVLVTVIINEIDFDNRERKQSKMQRTFKINEIY